MFEKFTERARKVMSLARQEAQRLESEYIGCEHILLGIIVEDGGVACKVFKAMNVDPLAIKLKIEQGIAPHPPAQTLGQLPFTPRAKRVIELAGECASQLNHDVIGTEHLLLALIKENESLAAMVLHQMGLKLETARDHVLQVLGADGISNDSWCRKEMKVLGTIIDTRADNFTVLERNGDQKVVLYELLPQDEKIRQNLTKGRRVEIHYTVKVKLLD